MITAPAAFEHLPTSALLRVARYAYLAAMLATVVGCASSPVHYYTLVSPSHAVATDVASASRPAFDFTLMPIKAPAQVDQSALVLRLGSGQVAVLDNEQWAAPLGDELRSAFSDALTRHLGISDVTSLPSNSLRPLVQITIDVQRFDLYNGKSTTLEAVWSARSGGSPTKHIATCKASLTEQASGQGYTALIEGQQRAIDSIAAQIATVLTSWNGSDSPMCPPLVETMRR
jgi:uncharacterized lipoprotein YmbA